MEIAIGWLFGFCNKILIVSVECELLRSVNDLGDKSYPWATIIPRR